MMMPIGVAVLPATDHCPPNSTGFKAAFVETPIFITHYSNGFC